MDSSKQTKRKWHCQSKAPTHKQEGEEITEVSRAIRKESNNYDCLTKQIKLSHEGLTKLINNKQARIMFGFLKKFGQPIHFYIEFERTNQSSKFCNQR